jgi:D-3-phosphoglycerate dehydrogenase
MKVLISSRSFGKIDSGAIELLKNKGFEPVLNPHGRKLNEQEILDLLDDAVGIIAGTEKITEKIITSNTNLKVISRYGIGLDNIDLKAANQKNVIVYNTPETPTVAVAEFTLTLILNLLKKINKADNNLRKNEWKPETGNLLAGKTVGIIGLGRIGKKLSQFLTPFDVKILAYETSPDKEFVTKNRIELVQFDELISKSDIITLHVPLTSQTDKLIGKKQFESMKESAILINAARGGLVDEKALYDALKEKTIAGAAIDVFENEPDTGELKGLDNVILTPHIGAYTIETRKQMEIETVENLINGLKEMKVL